MTTNDNISSTPIDPPPNAIASALMALFKVGFVTFLLAGLLLVGLQAVGLISGNADLTINTIPHLPEVMTIAAGCTGLLAFLMSYLYSWDSSDD